MGERVWPPVLSREPVRSSENETGHDRGRPAGPAGRPTAVTTALLNLLFAGDPPSSIRVRLWDGSFWHAGRTSARTTIVLKHPGALRAMLAAGTELALAEAYLRDDFDVEGDIWALFECAGAFEKVVAGWSTKLRVANLLMQLPRPAPSPRPASPSPSAQDRPAGRGPAALQGRRHSVARDKQAISYHYDVSNDFYALWLDERMQYSCAYFRSPDDPLDRAQAAKLDHICRKLRLRPGQRLLDVGCGWGGLVRHAAREYGVDATGITLSRPQAELANEWIAQAGLSDHASVFVRDYREVAGPESFDALVSVGMFEHVGGALLPKYFGQAYSLLKPGGVFLNHGISSGVRKITRRGPSFSEKYVFPDGELVPIAETLRAAGEAGFEVRDLESLREHYALTLKHWVRRLEQNHEEALRHVEEPTYRVWRTFMSGGAYGFETGLLNVYQALLVKPDARGASRQPLTRGDWYAGATEQGCKRARVQGCKGERR